VWQPLLCEEGWGREGGVEVGSFALDPPVFTIIEEANWDVGASWEVVRGGMGGHRVFV